MNTVRDTLRKAGLRATNERISLYSQLEKAKKPITADALKTKLPSVDLATVYRNLESFVKAGLVEQLTLNANYAHYEIKHKHHHHVMCEGCERILSVDVCLSKAFLDEVKKKSGVSSITRHQLEFTGICKKCKN